MTPTPKSSHSKKSKTRPSLRPRARGQQSGSIRIIAGKHRGRRLPVLLSEGLRPTTDRTKETLFNWLMHDINEACVLDMFAGAGSLGFEALSRHASRVLMLEKDPKVAAQLEKNVSLVGEQSRSQVICGNAFDVLKSVDQSFDVVFIDPPFQMGFVSLAMNALIDEHLLNKGALIYVEQEKNLVMSDMKPFTKLKSKNTGQVEYALYKFTS